jgi:DNA processing protein
MVTEKFCHKLVTEGFTIVSGLARGIDTIAHRTVLDNGGKTIAVLGSGFNYFYPPENKQLGDRISEQGVVISEYPLDTIPDPVNFPRRNRIISGLSMGILVTEAGRSSGSLITAYQALEQNREVFAVPGPITSPKSAGANHLIKEGAILVQDYEDILRELESQFESRQATIQDAEVHLSEIEKSVFEALSMDPLHIDHLAYKIEKSASEVLSILLTLELMGLVKQLSGKMFIRNKN